MSTYNQGDQEPGKEPGDIIIQLEEKEHATFQRHGKDLTLRLDIDVCEALCGMKRTLKTLDNRNIVLTTSPGEIIKQADVKMIKGEGMPTYRDPFNKGKLIIIFNISYPDKIDPAAAKKIASLLPSPKLPPVPKDGEEVHLEEFDGKKNSSSMRTFLMF